jgi:uncharacterized protein
VLRAAMRAAGGVAAAGLAWSLFEAQWVELAERDIPIPGLPEELDGFRVLHLSDFHLGTFSLNALAVRRATTWPAAREVDVVVITGDLVSRWAGESHLREAVARLRARHGVYAILGNHDVAQTRDPFSRPGDVTGLDGARLLVHEAASFVVGGRTVQVVGCHPRRRRDPVEELADPDADLRILLSHFPDVAARLPAGAFQLVLAGHLHGGQICLPTPWGKLRLAHVRAPWWEGVHKLPGTRLHVSRGLGTTFVPFRFLARPEATVLRLTPEH